MGNLYRYSAIAAKLSAMRRHLLTQENFRELASLKSAASAVEYLKGFPSYSQIFDGIGETELHRGRIEIRLKLSLYHDYSRLYRFADRNQRRFLDLYFLHFEIDILKKCLRNVFSGHRTELNLSGFESFFAEHSSLDPLRLSTCASLPEFLECLDGTFFHKPFKELYEHGTASLFEYETALDSLYFTKLWKDLNSRLGKREKNAVLSSFEQKIDLMNLEWLSRAKRHYRFLGDTILEFLIPVHGLLTKDQLLSMAASADLEEFYRILKTTPYGNRLMKGEHFIKKEHSSFHALLDDVYRNSQKKDPYSAAALNSYFYFKEEEIRKLITAIEGIRYGLDRNEILACLEGNEKEVLFP